MKISRSFISSLSSSKGVLSSSLIVDPFFLIFPVKRKDAWIGFVIRLLLNKTEVLLFDNQIVVTLVASLFPK